MKSTIAVINATKTKIKDKEASIDSKSPLNIMPLVTITNPQSTAPYNKYRLLKTPNIFCKISFVFTFRFLLFVKFEK